MNGPPIGEATDHALMRLALELRAAGYRFVTPTPATHTRVNARPGNESATDLHGVFGWSRPFEPAVLAPGLLDLMKEAGVVECAGPLLRSKIRYSTLGDALFAHSAYPTTEPDAVFFGPDTYRFCQAVGRALHRAAPPQRAVDLCAGAGPGAITIAFDHPDCDVLAADINERALALCAVNAASANARVKTRKSNLLQQVEGDFDLIVANPPYLNDPGRRAYRHGGGHHGEGLSVQILQAALPRLRPGGRLVVYTGVAILRGADPFRQAAEQVLAGRPERFEYEEIDPDVFGEELDEPAYADADRIAAVVLTVTRPQRNDACPTE